MRLKNIIPQPLKKYLVQSLLFPLFDYADSVYQDLTDESAYKLQKVQNSCVRFICNILKYDHISPYYNNLSLLLHPIQ